MALASGVVEGEHGTRRNPVPPNTFRNAVPPNDVRTRGNGDTLAFPQIGLQINAKSMVKVNSFVIKVKCLISYIVICICESVIHRLKSNIVTALFTTFTSQCWFVTWYIGLDRYWFCCVCTKFVKLIRRKVITIVATRCHILKLKCTSSAPDPLAGFKGFSF